MCISCGYRHTLRICNNYCFSTATMVTRTASMLRYTYITWQVCYPSVVGYNYVSLKLRPLTDDRWQWWRIQENRSTYLESDLSRSSFPNRQLPHRHPLYYNSELLLKQFFPASYYFLLFGSQDLLDTLFSNTPNLCSSPKHNVTYKFKLYKLHLTVYSKFVS
jgi:hypothetical protein